MKTLRKLTESANQALDVLHQSTSLSARDIKALGTIEKLIDHLLTGTIQYDFYEIWDEMGNDNTPDKLV